jgi:S1-C subfamily serine protease
MIGLNSAIVSPNSSNGQLSSQKIAIGFSLPSNIVYQVFKQICDHGRPMRAYLGIDLMENTIPLREHLNFRDTTGSIVNEVFPDSPADRAGVRTGDVITEYNGRRVKNTIDLIRNIESLQVGDTVKLTIWRNGAKQFVRLLLDRTEQGVVPPGIFQKTTGIRLRNLTMKQRLNGFRGVIVDTVPESLKSALRVGDIIHAVDYETIESVNEVDNIFRNNGIDVLNISRRNIRFNVSLKKEGSLTQPKETETSVKETEEEQENKSN